MLDKVDRDVFLRRMKRPNLNALVRASTFKKMLAECKKNKHCPYCNVYNGTVKKMPGQVCKVIQVITKKSMDEEEGIFEDMEKTFANNPVHN